MRREIPLGVAVVIIVVVVILVFGIGWWLISHQPAPEGKAPKEFMPKPPYAPGGGQIAPQPPGR